MHALIKREIGGNRMQADEKKGALSAAVDELGKSVVRYLGRPCKRNLRELIAKQHQFGELQQQLTGQEDDFNYAALEAALERLP